MIDKSSFILDKKFLIDSVTDKSIKISHFEVPFINDVLQIGELRLYFNPKDWNVYKDGYLCTNTRFVVLIREYFSELFGATITDIGYPKIDSSMQNDDCISYIVGRNFLWFWNKKLVDQHISSMINGAKYTPVSN